MLMHLTNAIKPLLSLHIKNKILYSHISETSMSITLSSRELSDLECLLDGSFAPLTGFMNQVDYEGVVENCHLANGSLWALPVVLHISEAQKVEFEGQSELFLRDETFLPVAKLTNFEIYMPNLEKECLNVYGTVDTNHPTVNRLLNKPTFAYYLGGQVNALNPIQHYDFVKSRLTPQQVKAEFAKKGWTTVVGFQTRNPLHRSHVELTRLGMKLAGSDAKLLLHPVVGDTQECDIDYFTRCLCYEKICQYYPEDSMMLALLPYSMRMGGPREALQHAIIRKTYGCTHFIVGHHIELKPDNHFMELIRLKSLLRVSNQNSDSLSCVYLTCNMLRD